MASLLPPIRHLLLQRDELLRQKATAEEKLAVAEGELTSLHAKFFEAWKQRENIWVPPGHFYSPIPDAVGMELNTYDSQDGTPAISGVSLKEEGELALLKEFAKFYDAQPFTAEAAPDRRYFFENPNYSYGDAIVLYCMMRHASPRRIVEIGSGYSSCAMLDINELFFENSIACTFIEPYPQLLRDHLKETDFERIRILDRPVQNVDSEVFSELQPSDILFIDSSHVTKTGSDVNYIVFEVLPYLAEGVLIHFHDIFYPFEYPDSWINEGRAWNEAYLLRAFLQYNDAFEIQFFTSFLMEKHRNAFESALPLCLKCPGAGLWLKKTRRDPQLEGSGARTKRKHRSLPRKLEPAKPGHAPYLKTGWYDPEAQHRWTTSPATFEIAGPTAPEQFLVIDAVSMFTESQVWATADHVPLGSSPLRQPGAVTIKFALPDQLIGRPSITVDLKLDHIHTAPNDSRKLGLAVHRIEVR